MPTTTANSRKAVHRLKFPWWRRVLAPFSLASTVIIVGLSVAAVVVAAAMLMLYILEQAVG
jgi:hypothetical protein